MANAMQELGALYCRMAVYADFYDYEPGTIYTVTDTDAYEGGHAVVCHGFGTSDSGQKYWSCINSWGDTWGSHGRSEFMIERGTDMAEIESRGCYHVAVDEAQIVAAPPPAPLAQEASESPPPPPPPPPALAPPQPPQSAPQPLPPPQLLTPPPQLSPPTTAGLSPSADEPSPPSFTPPPPLPPPPPPQQQPPQQQQQQQQQQPQQRIVEHTAGSELLGKLERAISDSSGAVAGQVGETLNAIARELQKSLEQCGPPPSPPSPVQCPCLTAEERIARRTKRALYVATRESLLTHSAVELHMTNGERTRILEETAELLDDPCAASVTGPTGTRGGE